MLKGDANDSILELWQCKNTTYTAATSGACPSTDSRDYYLWEEDLEIINQEEFKEITLGDTFSHSEDIQMPWLLTSQNMVPNGHARDCIGVFQMPGVQNERMREIEMEWITRFFGGPSQAQQVNATLGQRITWMYHQRIPNANAGERGSTIHRLVLDGCRSHHRNTRSLVGVRTQRVLCTQTLHADQKL